MKNKNQLKIVKIYISAILVMSLFSSWGFQSHQSINRLAIFTLPPTISPFYKKHIQFITKHAIDPDKRRYAVKDEAARHYIDCDEYGGLENIPHDWNVAVEKFSADTLKKHGLLPWHIVRMKYRLTQAFENHDLFYILKNSADIGHYIADAHVPLHTTSNYNGQLTNQVGIHAFWETRLPELFMQDYNFFVGQAEYINDINPKIWSAISSSNQAVDSVLRLERELSNSFHPSKKYSFETRKSISKQVYSREFSEKYHDLLNHMVEKRMRNSIKLIGDIWYTAWVDAGQPPIETLLNLEIDDHKMNKYAVDRKSWIKTLFQSRSHEH